MHQKLEKDEKKRWGRAEYSVLVFERNSDTKVYGDNREHMIRGMDLMLFQR